MVRIEIVLRCYELAKFYQQDPGVFLRKPLSALRRDMARTMELIARIKPEPPAED
jgi:hypothetical protein